MEKVSVAEKSDSIRNFEATEKTLTQPELEIHPDTQTLIDQALAGEHNPQAGRFIDLVHPRELSFAREVGRADGILAEYRYESLKSLAIFTTVMVIGWSGVLGGFLYWCFTEGG